MSQHTIRTLVGDKEDQTIVFGGLSAGGRGAVITIDQIKDLVHPSTTIRGLIDSAGYEVGYLDVLQLFSDKMTVFSDYTADWLHGPLFCVAKIDHISTVILQYWTPVGTKCL